LPWFTREEAEEEDLGEAKVEEDLYWAVLVILRLFWLAKMEDLALVEDMDMD
jgi:hypothetical protein